MAFKKISYPQKARIAKNPIARKLLAIMTRKKTNLALAADEPSAKKVLQLAETLGPKICLLKTHIDIIADFKPEITRQLVKIAQKHDFLIFEDRKFADIGNTVKMQYEKGIYKIADWADLTNAHGLPGPGLVEGLKEVAAGKKMDRGLILLAQMSSAGNLAGRPYTKKIVKMAKQHSDFVIGFIGNGGDINELKKLVKIAGHFIIFTPGVKLGGGRDKLKQRYTTPGEVIRAGSDIIVVGRGIYETDQPLSLAEEYRQAGWQAYQKSQGKK